MHGRLDSRRWTLAAIVAAGLVLGALPAHAQGGGSGFAFRAPTATLTFRAGAAFPKAGGELFDFATDTLTLKRGDLLGSTAALDLGFGPPGGRWDVVFGVGYQTSSAESEFRNWTDTDDQPITQTTSFKRVPVSLSLRTWLLPRGRSLGRFAWVPTAIAPYVGVGAGMMHYDFTQKGDFVDYQTLDVFPDTFRSSGWGVMGQGMVGADVSLSPHVALTGDVRYIYSKADVGQDFDGFGQVDLSGLATTLGITFRF